MADMKINANTLSSVSAQMMTIKEQGPNAAKASSDDLNLDKIAHKINSMISADGIEPATKDTLKKTLRSVEGMQNRDSHPEQPTASGKANMADLSHDLNELLKNLPSDDELSKDISFYLNGEQVTDPTKVVGPSAKVDMQRVAWDLGEDKNLSPRIQDALMRDAQNYALSDPKMTLETYKKQTTDALVAQGVGEADAKKLVDHFAEVNFPDHADRKPLEFLVREDVRRAAKEEEGLKMSNW